MDKNLDNILLGGDDAKGRDSKKVLALIIGIVVLGLAIAIIMLMMNSKQNSEETIVLETPPSIDSAMPQGGFNAVNIDNETEDKFDQIVRDIKNSNSEIIAPTPEPERVTMPQKPDITPPTPRASAPATMPRRMMNRLNNGDIAENGYYLQVGAFSKTPNRAFIDSLNNYSYRTQEIMINSNVITRYLVGPYKSREEAQRDYERVSRDVAKPVFLLVQ